MAMTEQAGGRGRMAYTKTNWTTAKISDANLNKMQQQYGEAVVDMWNARTDTTKEIRAYVVSDFPAHKAGLLIFHTGLKRFFMSNGSAWLVPPADAFFGGGTGGDYSSTGNITLTNAVGATVIADYSSFTLNENHTLTTQNPCRCLIIRSWGDIVIDGEINLDKKGGFGDRYLTLGGVQYDLMGGDGGNGGNGGDGGGLGGDGGSGGSISANENCAGGRRGGGGGGGGASHPSGSGMSDYGANGGPKNTKSDPGAAGGSSGYYAPGQTHDQATAGTRGSGGGGGAGGFGPSGYTAVGGDGGSSINGGAAGGGGAACITGYTNRFADSGFPSIGEYGGGALVLIAGGNIVIDGQILARGGKGGNGGDGDGGGASGSGAGAGGGGGGGGQGGGRVIILRRGSYTLNGAIVLTGGAGGSGGAPGSAGGSAGSAGSSGGMGSVQAVQI